LSVRITLWCDGPRCTEVAPLATTGQGTVAEVDQLRRGLAELGWMRIQCNPSEPWRDLCPRCAALVRMITSRRARRSQFPLPTIGD